MQPDGPADFDSTRWTLIDRVRGDSEADRRAALEELLQRYLPALQSHLVLRRGLQSQDAADVLQDFVTHKILERDLVSRADRQRGRFRAFLLTALDRFVVDHVRYRKAQKRVAADTVSIDAAGSDPPGPPTADVFDIAWGRTVLKEALRLMKEGCEQEHAQRTWEVFCLRVLDPLIHGEPPLDYEVLVKRCGFETPRQAANALITARRRFLRCLNEVVAEYAGTEEELREEIDDLREIMSARGAFSRDVLPFELASAQDVTPAADVSIDSMDELADLFRLQEDSHPWQDRDLRQMLRHLLDTPIAQLLQWSQITHIPATWHQRRLGELFAVQNPPLELLEQTKWLGRYWIQHEAHLIPSEVGATLYFASIAAAMIRHDARISTSSDRVLYEGFRRVSERAWVDPRLRELLLAAQRT